MVVDGGNSLGPNASRGAGEARAQLRVKAELIAQAYHDAGIDALALGASDWALGAGWLRELVTAQQLPVVAANLTCGGEAPYPSDRVVTAGEYRIGVVGVTLGGLRSRGGCEVAEPLPALERAVAELRPGRRRAALIPAANDREAAPFRTGRPPVGFSARRAGSSVRCVDRENSTLWLLSGGSRGKTVGLATLGFAGKGRAWSSPGEAESVKRSLELDQARIEGLEDRLAKTPTRRTPTCSGASSTPTASARETRRAEVAAIEPAPGRPAGSRSSRSAAQRRRARPAGHRREDAPVLSMKAKITELGSQGGTLPADVGPRLVKDAASPFAGAQACASCHQTEQTQWMTTAHARAWSGLVSADRALDDECWRCHVTGAGAEGGPATAQAVSGFTDVQCEQCHGPGRAHAADPTQPMVKSPTLDACTACHDGERDEGRGFDASFREKVVHTAAAAPTPAPAP
ncbi:MAG: multiheme c-type cytochrome [Myxococcota bacterium]